MTRLYNLARMWATNPESLTVDNFTRLTKLASGTPMKVKAQLHGTLEQPQSEPESPTRPDSYEEQCETVKDPEDGEIVAKPCQVDVEELDIYTYELTPSETLVEEEQEFVFFDSTTENGHDEKCLCEKCLAVDEIITCGSVPDVCKEILVE